MMDTILKEFSKAERTLIWESKEIKGKDLGAFQPWKKYDSLYGCLARIQKEKMHSFNTFATSEFCDIDFLHLAFSFICSSHCQVCSSLIYIVYIT